MKEQFKRYVNQICPLQEDTLQELLNCFIPSFLKKNAFFVQEGEQAKKVGFLNEGIVRAYFLNDEGKEYNKQFFVGPSIIGAYTSLLTRQPNKIAQQALTDCQIMIADFSKIESLYNQYHELERLGRRIAEFYFLEKEKKEIEMALLDAEQRYYILRDTFPRIELEISQYHIASYLGISPTQLSRIRRKIADQ